MKKDLQFKFDPNKEMYLPAPDPKKFSVGMIISYAPYNVKVTVVDVYHNNWIKRVLAKLGIQVRANEIKVRKTNIPNPF